MRGIIPPTCGVDSGGIQNSFDFRHGGFLLIKLFLARVRIYSDDSRLDQILDHADLPHIRERQDRRKAT
jgi:hypothetical protein